VSFFTLFRPLPSFTDEWPYPSKGLHFTGEGGKGRETPMASDKREVGSSTLPRPISQNLLPRLRIPP
jgi:hypothetical protein